jgi:hypothetical protein
MPTQTISEESAMKIINRMAEWEVCSKKSIIGLLLMTMPCRQLWPDFGGRGGGKFQGGGKYRDL